MNNDVTSDYEVYFDTEFDFNDEERKQQIARRLKECIKASDMNQYQFANKCKISYETLRTYLKGYASIRFDVLIRAAHALDVSYEYLLCDDAENEQPAEKPLPIRIQNATHLSLNASNKLVELGFRYRQSKNIKRQVDCISELIENDGILEQLTKYFCFVKNKNVKEWKAKNKEEWQYAQEIVTCTESECDCETVLLFQTMKKIENAVKRKLSNQNQ